MRKKGLSTVNCHVYPHTGIDVSKVSTSSTRLDHLSDLCLMVFATLIRRHAVTPRWLDDAKDNIQLVWSKQRDCCALANEIPPLSLSSHLHRSLFYTKQDLVFHIDTTLMVKVLPNRFSIIWNGSKCVDIHASKISQNSGTDNLN